MNYTLTELTYPSTNGRDTIHAYIYAPVSGEVRGIVQLSHGMIDYVGRYEALAEYLTARGYIFAGNDHLGHGKSAADESELGYFEVEGSALCLVRDLHALTKRLKQLYPSLPIVLFGHSMGSFISRLYAEKYPHSIAGHIIHGTGGPLGPAVPLGKLVVKLISKFKGKRHRSKLLNNLAFGSYNSRFKKSEGKHAWLTRDTARVASRDTDKFTSYIFTASGYQVLFSLVADCNSKKWFAEYPKQMKTLIMSGSMDPVGSYGKGTRCVYKQLVVGGASDVTMKLYEGARHELFNETCREEAFADIVAWLSQITK